MKLSRILLVVLMASTALWAAEGVQKFVKPITNNVPVYKDKSHAATETPLFSIGTDDRLLIVSTAGDLYEVQNATGTGWVDKKLMVIIGTKKSFSFDNAEVLGYIDNPTPIYIIDQDDPNSEKITLDRSFKDALRDNVDKMTLEREAR
jgi:hypothetical protein